MIVNEDQKILFVNRVAQIAQEQGWHKGIMPQVCRDLGLTEEYYLIWFEQGIISILRYLENAYDQEMLQILASLPKPTSITQQIAQALKIRICGTSRTKTLAQKNSAYYLKNLHITDLASFAWQSVDLVWQQAGDLSLDYNYYSKRALLHGIYLAAQIRYNTDQSDDNIATKEFIDKSLHQLVGTIKRIKQVPNVLKKIPFLRIFI